MEQCGVQEGQNSRYEAGLRSAGPILERYPVQGANAFMELEEYAKQLRITRPLIPSESIDVLVSNCVLIMVDTEQKKQLFEEIHRVLRNGGRAVISDLVCDEKVLLALQQGPDP